MQQVQQHMVRRGFFLLFVLLVTVAFFRLISDFLMAAFWATVLAVIFRNSFRRLRITLRGRTNLAAFSMTLLILLLVVLPTFFLVQALVRESLNFYDQIQTGQLDLGKVVAFLERQIPQVQSLVSQFGISTQELQERISNAALSMMQLIADRVLDYTQNAIIFTVQFILMLYLLFFFLRDGDKIVRAIINVLPLGNRQERMFFKRFSNVAQATLKGLLVVGGLQGIVGGVLFWAVGIEGAVFWGIVMTFFSILPVGSGVVWIPAAIVLIAQGDVVRGIIIILVGTLIIGLIDNILRPILVGRDTKMPDYLVLTTTLGGITWFGLAGFVLGPIIAALLLSCWEIVGREYGGREL